MRCLGNTPDHCCYLDSKPCPHLEENTVEGRRWACGLRRKLGNWDDVLESKEYKADVLPVFGPIGINCKDWPKGKHCGECGYGVENAS